jgi:divalent metal cation (Fe/Co/Zn/Cd) transporter
VSAATTGQVAARVSLLRHGLRLEYLTVGWNILEGIVAIAAAVSAGSVALLGFGIDSFVESVSGSVLVWRLRAEHGGRHKAEAIERIERRAERLVGASFLLLAAYVAVDASLTLLRGERPEGSPVGIGLTIVSLVVMLWLAGAKRRRGVELGSRALIADAAQTQACWYLSATTLAGLGLNAAFGLWWADPLAGYGIAYFLVREGLEAWRGEEHEPGEGNT